MRHMKIYEKDMRHIYLSILKSWKRDLVIIIFKIIFIISKIKF